MDRILKFILKLGKKDREWVLEAYYAILENRLDALDIKQMEGRKCWFRCRIGNIRIVFVRISAGANIIQEVNFRDKEPLQKSAPDTGW